MSRKERQQPNPQQQSIDSVDDIEVKLQQAISFYQAGQLQQAEQICQQILQFTPQNAEVIHLLGKIAHQVERYDLAINLINQAIEIDPNQSSFFNNLGLILQKQEKFEAAIQAYQQAIELNSESAESYYNLGILLQEQNRSAEAIQAYRDAIEINPNYNKAHNNLGSMLEAQEVRRKRQSIRSKDSTQVTQDINATLQNLNRKFSSADSWDTFGEALTETKVLTDQIKWQPAPSLAQVCEESFIRLLSVTIGIVSLEHICFIPVLFERCQYNAKHKRWWLNYRNTLLTSSPRSTSDEIIWLIVLSNIIDSILTNRWTALSNMITQILNQPKLRLLNNNCVDYLGSVFAQSEWFQNEPDLKKTVISHWNESSRHSEEIRKWVYIILPLLGFNGTQTSPVDWMTFLFNSIVLSIINIGLQINNFNAALLIESLASGCYATRNENAQFFKNSYVDKIMPLFLEAGRRHKTTMPPITDNDENIEVPHKVCFFLHNSSFLAHTRNLFNYFRGLKEFDRPPIQPTLILFDDVSDQIQNLANENQVEIVSFPDSGYYERILRIRQWNIDNNVTAFVWSSTLLFMPFAFSMRIAPVQIFWSMKYHSVKFDEIDGYLTTGSFEKYRTIDGKKWRVGHGALDSLYKPELEGDAKTKRKELTDDENCIIFGCLGRETKINNDQYAGAIAQILKQVPNSIYIWTGRVNHPEILSRFRKLGILDRCRFVGWINTALYAQVLDVFVDSFPFASGHTAFESMAAGCPVVVRITPESLETSSLTHILPAFHCSYVPKDIQEDIKDTWLDENGNILLPIVEDLNNYVNTAVQLATDRDFRHRIGELSRMFVNRFMTDTKLMAKTYTNHILDIINQSRNKSNEN